MGFKIPAVSHSTPQTHLEYTTNVFQVKSLMIHQNWLKYFEISAYCRKPNRVWNWVGAQRKNLILIILSLTFHESLVKDCGVLEHTLLWQKCAEPQTYFNSTDVVIM